MPSNAVWYVGTSTVRRVADWNEVGVVDATAGQDVPAVWSPGNGWSVDGARFSPQQLGWLRGQPEFYVAAPDGPRQDPSGSSAGRLKVRPATPAGVNVYGSGVTAVSDASTATGTTYRLDGPGVRALRDATAPSGYTYLIEET